MKPSLAVKKFAMLFGNLALHIVGYLAINAYSLKVGMSHDLAMGLDSQIPFVKYFVPFYSIVYFLPVSAFFLCWDDYATIKAGAKAFAVAGIFCFACFLLYPVKYQLRVELHPPYDFFTNILRFFYWVDAPYNCFPSLHVALAVISALIIRRARPRLVPLYYLLAAIICASVLFMKQHYVLDVAGGLGVSWLMKAMFLPKESEKTPGILGPAAA
ncbi:MAG: phosphatase PAP2 family protein [Deltaproteobacteria bacterium]|nr:phosphatase PAP2 family protein [Deltaproteobacteria bacterium]